MIVKALKINTRFTENDSNVIFLVNTTYLLCLIKHIAIMNITAPATTRRNATVATTIHHGNSVTGASVTGAEVKGTDQNQQVLHQDTLVQFSSHSRYSISYVKVTVSASLAAEQV